MKIWRPNAASSKVLISAQKVLNSYPYPITFKQLYYRLVSEGVIDNSMPKYRMLNNLITNARKYGRLSPSLFVPKQVGRVTAFSPEDYLGKCIDLYHLDRTRSQKNYVEVWVERNTIFSFVEHLLAPYDIPVYVMQGNSNYAFAYQAYQRLQAAADEGKVPRVICLTDLCVSSYNSFEYFLSEMASLFGVSYQDMSSIIFCLGILPDHIVRYDLVEAPNTTKDSRVRGFDQKYGDLLESLDFPRNTRVEIEAIDPKSLRDLLYNTIFGIIDYGLMLEVEKREATDKKKLLSSVLT